ncbi:MAG: hypothetical protein FD180_3330 [Planctomycetota bacterium]|nr:MAG: hypothetical protein FD180_3330 [Planctomycetota bacterium]
MGKRVFIGMVACLLLALVAGLCLRERGKPTGSGESASAASPEGGPAEGTAIDGKDNTHGKLAAPPPRQPAVRLRISGRVLDHEGGAAGGCRVGLTQDSSFPSPTFGLSTKCDSEGAFRFEVDQSMRYVLSAADGRVTQPVDLSDGKDVDGIEIRLPKGRIIAVTVADMRGTAVRGALVALPREEGAPSALTDERGGATLTGFDEYVAVQVMSAPEDGRRYLLPPEDLLYPGDNEARFVLEDAGLASGVVLTPRGLAWKGGAVAAVEKEGTLGWSISTAATDIEGRFEITVPLGKTVILVPEFGEREPTIKESADEAPVRVIGSLGGVKAGDRDLVLQLQVEPLDRSLKIRVESPTGKAVAGAPVSLFEQLETPLSSRITNAVGLAEFPGLPARMLMVEVSPPPGDPAAAEWVKGIVRRVVPEGQELVVRLRAGFRISGVILKPNGEPCAGASVCTMIRRPDSGVVTVGADGRFSLLFDSEDVDLLDLEAWGEADGLRVSASVKLRDRSVREVTIRLERGD